MLELDCGRQHDSRQQETRLAKLALDIKESELPDAEMFMLNLPGSASRCPVGHFIRFIVMGAWGGVCVGGIHWGCVLASTRPW